MSENPIGAEVLVIANSRSGASLGRPDRVPDVRRRLPGATVHELGENETLDDVVAKAVAGSDAPRVLAILGGDGSVSRAAHLARRHDLTLLVLPNGTFNHFARSAGIEDVDAGLDAYEHGAVRSVVVAEVRIDDRDPVTVLNAVSLGAYPELLVERERRSSLGKWWGGAVAAWRALHDAHAVGIARRGRRASVWSVFIGVGRNDPERIAMMQRATLDDAVVDVRIHHARGTRMRAVASLAFGRRSISVLRAVRLMPPASDLERIVSADIDLEVRAGSAPDIYVHDGELEQVGQDGFRLRVSAIDQGLRVYLPGR
ncbi:undecaprenyl-diphosphatase [Microbacterium marinum]|uniref:Undecaprenyl-diphosphatase n=1 Tax=Microbacterium marinum TaxID=421115 RepID=A0A7W7FJC5_9MICO|nr:diacylglycerol kinase family protein [Microbacterium marinum]MBB4668286.1 undecaprenyl-diphosphatase [Microbacterium marinum]